MVTDSATFQCSSGQIPQLPAFNDTQWIDSTIQAISDDDIASAPLLLYVIACCRTDT